MSKIKQNRAVLLRLYLSLIVFCVCFFTMYAFRYDVLNILYQHDSFTPSDKVVAQVEKELSTLEATNKNINQFIEVLKPLEKDYNYSLFTVTDKDNEKVPNEEQAYFYISSGAAPNKHSNNYSTYLDVQFHGEKGLITLYPNFNSYLFYYSIVSAFVSLLLSLFVYMVIKRQLKTHRFTHFIKRAYMRLPFKSGKKISFQIVMITLLLGVFAGSFFLFTYTNRYAFFDFVREGNFTKANYDSYMEGLSEKLDGIALTKKNKAKIIELISSDSDRYETYVFDELGVFYVSSYNNRISSMFLRESVYNISSIYTPEFYQYPFFAKDEVGTILIYDFPLVRFAVPIVVLLAMVSLSLFLIPLLLFIRYKVNHIKQIQEDIEVLASGDWSYEVNRNSDDEIGELADHLNQLRLSFVDNMEKEKQAMQANKELITSLSHDIRTPLTSLQGYLEIIHLKKYKDAAQYEQYLQNCIEKVQQINELSTKTFEYALVFEVEDEYEKQWVAMDELCDYVKNSVEYLHLQHFKIQMKIEVNANAMLVNLTFWKRIINNLFSNVLKYADASKEVCIYLTQEKDCLKLSIANEKKQMENIVESNHIGLKSVRRMVQLLHGEMYINEQDDSFIVVLSLPMSE